MDRRREGGREGKWEGRREVRREREREMEGREGRERIVPTHSNATQYIIYFYDVG